MPFVLLIITNFLFAVANGDAIVAPFIMAVLLGALTAINLTGPVAVGVPFAFTVPATVLVAVAAATAACLLLLIISLMVMRPVGVADVLMVVKLIGDAVVDDTPFTADFEGFTLTDIVLGVVPLLELLLLLL